VRPITSCRRPTRMNAHKNARTTAFGRAVMVRRVLEEGWSVAAVASAFEISTRTVRKWLARFASEGEAGLQNRSSAPHLVANKLPAPWLAMIARLRRDYRMTGEEVAGRLQLPRSTVAGHLARLGLGRLTQLEPSEPARRYNRARAGELVHFDVKKLARFRRVGHRITGDRRRPSGGAGWEFVHVAVDDASRLAFVEVLPDEKRQSVTGFLVRALRWFKRLGIRVERVMLGLRLAPLPQGLPDAPRAPPPHQAVHAQDQWQGRAVHPDPCARVGLRPAVPQL
jgi:transposase